MSKETALQHIKGAWIVGLISAGMTLLVSVLAAMGVSALAEMGFGWWTLFDVALTLGLSFGVYRKSRIAASLLFIYFVGARISLAVATGSVRGLPVALIVGYFLVQGIRGTFVYQAMVLNEYNSPTAAASTARKSSWRWMWILGGTFAFLAVALMAGVIYVGMAGPDIAVIPGAQVRKAFVAKIHALNLLEPDEKLLFFYSDALVDIENGFYLLTDRKVVVYRKDYVQPKLIVPISDIKDMDVSWSDSFWDDTRVTLTLADDSQVRFPLSGENGGDKAFCDTLKKKWEDQTRNLVAE